MRDSYDAHLDREMERHFFGDEVAPDDYPSDNYDDDTDSRIEYYDGIDPDDDEEDTDHG